MSLQIRRGLEADRASVTPLEGEFLFTTDTGLIYIGDGTTAGGIPAGGGAGGVPGGSNPTSGNNGTTWVGDSALTTALTPDYGAVTAVGSSALKVMAVGNTSTAVGTAALSNVLGSAKNTGVGSFAGGMLGKTQPGTDITVGNEYVIVDAATFDYTTIGAGSNNVGAVFVATGVATDGQVSSFSILNTFVGALAGGGDSIPASLIEGNGNILIGAFAYTQNTKSNNEIVIGTESTGKGENTTSIGTANTTQTYLYGKLKLDKAPTTSVGDPGDVAGMIAADASYLYHCTGDYDGSTAIWLRVTGTTW